MGDRYLVGTRGSRLALAQAKLVVEELRAVRPDADFVTVPIKTAGDLAPPNARVGMDGKSAFTGEIDRQLVDGKVDFAVHSMKDLPTALDERLVVAATPRRGDPRDALVNDTGLQLASLGKGAKIGTSSVRRKAQLLRANRGFEVVGLVGNVETRLRKLKEEELDAVVLAAAGLERLGLGGRIAQKFRTDEMIPAVCQGVLAIEAAASRDDVLSMLRGVDDPATRAASDCERAFSGELGGDCYVPLGAYAEVRGGSVGVTGMLADVDGVTMAKADASGSAGDAAKVGRELARKVLDQGGEEILRRLRS